MSHSSPRAGEAAFTSAEGLRTLLIRLHTAGPGAWKHDPDATALMRFTANRYAGLAHKYGATPEDAAAAAFEVMLSESTRKARDTWAVVTWAVRITLIAEQRAQGLLTSTERARRPQYSVFHDATRFSDHETDLTDFHPAFHVSPPELDELDGAGTAGADATSAVARTVELLRLLGWDSSTAARGVDYICTRLLSTGDRGAAYEGLRRDKSARALLDLPHKSWIGLLRLVLGHPAGSTANARRGVLVRVLLGETLAELLEDDDLVIAVAVTNPERRRSA